MKYRLEDFTSLFRGGRTALANEVGSWNSQTLKEVKALSREEAVYRSWEGIPPFAFSYGS